MKLFYGRNKLGSRIRRENQAENYMSRLNTELGKVKKPEVRYQKRGKSQAVVEAPLRSQ